MEERLYKETEEENNRVNKIKMASSMGKHLKTRLIIELSNESEGLLSLLCIINGLTKSEMIEKMIKKEWTESVKTTQK